MFLPTFVGMNKYQFYKYQGTGNDFIVFDGRNWEEIPSLDVVENLCERKFGVGSDGLIILKSHSEADFEMLFYNPDGSQSFCGNGSRCAVAFAKYLGVVKESAHFLAIDGEHDAIIHNNGNVSILMNDVQEIIKGDSFYFLDTGSPHHICYTNGIQDLNVVEEGRAIRYSDPYGEKGANVNFLEEVDASTIKIRTYERGVENETLSCGTGVTASALSLAVKNDLVEGEIDVMAMGGELKVSFKKEGDTYTDIWLTGPAKQVFKGEVKW